MCEPPYSNQQPRGVKKISYKPPPSLKKSINITFIENGLIIFEFFNYKQTDQRLFLYVYIH